MICNETECLHYEREQHPTCQCVVSENMRTDDYEDALQRIASWADAYPLDIFPEPDFAKARELLAAGGITLDAVSASCMRHVIDGVGKIAKDALDAAKEKA